MRNRNYLGFVVIIIFVFLMDAKSFGILNFLSSSKQMNIGPVRADLSEVIGNELSKLLSPFSNYIKTILVTYELSTMARTIEVKAIGKNIFPTPENFPQYLRDTMQSSRDPSLDLWGTPYVFERRGKVGIITSCGPDKQRGTSDDIRQELQLP